MATVLELQICRLHPREYEVRVVKAAAGGEPRAPLLLNVDELLEQRPELEDKVVFSADPTRRVVRPGEQLMQRVGRRLFDALFADQILGTYRASLSVAQERQERLQIVLRLEPPELTLLPWEALFDSYNDSYVCLREPIVRHLPASHTLNPLPVEPPLRILAAIASPRGLPLLDTDSERALLEKALADQVAAGWVELVWLTDASWTSLHDRLHAGPWHVLHFIGHGDYDLHYEEGQIALVGEHGRAQMVEASRLAALIALADPVPRLVVLNSCKSAEGGGAGDGFSSVGAALVRSGISAVAAMQFSISDRASLSFARGFYTALAYGRRVDDAVRSGRISMLGASKSLEWITPVLYVRGEENLLFRTQNEPPKERGQRKHRLYAQAMEELRIGNLGKAIESLDDLLSLEPDNSKAIKLRDQAAKQEQLIKVYERATEAEVSEDWPTAIDCYEQIMQQDPDYRDTTTRHHVCRNRQRITHLQERLRSYASQEQWQAAIEISEELDQLDPATADPDGLSTQARQKLANEQYTAHLENLYTQAFTAERSEDWNTALNHYEQIMQQNPDYRDTTTRHHVCRNRQRTTRSTSGGRGPSVMSARKTLVIGTPCGAIAWGSSDQHQALAIDVWDDAQIRIYDLVGASLLNIKTGRKGAPYIAAFSPDGKRLVSKGKKGAIIWDAHTGKPLLQVPSGNRTAAANFKSDGTYLATGSYNLARIWDAETADKIFSATTDRAIQAVAFSPDGNRLIVADQRGLHVWQVDTDLKIFEDLRGFLNSVAYSPDGKRAAAGSSTDSKAYLWNPGKIHELAHNAPVRSVTFGSDGTRLATGSEDGTARIWDATNAHMVCKIVHDDPITSLAFSPRGTRLATGTRRAVTVWELKYV